MLTAAAGDPANGQALSGILLCGTDVSARVAAAGYVVQAGVAPASPGLRA